MLAQQRSFGAMAGVPARHRLAVVRVSAATPSTDGTQQLLSKAAGAMLTAAAACSLVLSSAPAASAAPIRLAERREVQEQAFQEQLARLEYAFQQQQTAAKAELAGKRQALDSTVVQLETSIQQKLNEEVANERAAASKGDDARAARIDGDIKKIRQQEQGLLVAAAKAEAQLDREALVEKAREAEQAQQVDKAGSSVMELLGLSAKDLM